MGSYEDFNVHGSVRFMDNNEVKQLIVELKTVSEVWEKLCGFCYRKCESDKPRKARIHKHSHELKGSFTVIPAQDKLILTVIDCGKENDSDLDPEKNEQITDGRDSVLDEDTDNTKVPPVGKPNVIQYEVDGKVYEFKSFFPGRKKSNSKKSTSKLKQDHDNNSTTNSIEYVIEDKIYSLPKANFDIVKNSLKDDEEDSTIIENSLELLQVKLMEGSIVPSSITCGPDTASFLQNMRELAKLVASNQPLFKCDQCNEQLSSYFPYIEHIFKHFGTRPYTCAVCQSTFQTRAVMRHHLDMHGGKAPFQCEFCGKKFRNSCHMKQHRMRHTGEKPHRCNFCNKTFAHKNVLKMHLQSHTGQKPCQCDLCGKMFREPHRLGCHLETHYRSSKSFECQNCGKKFKTSGMLRLHSSKRCKGQVDDKVFESLQNATFITSIDESDSLNENQEVAIIEAETLEDGTMVLPANTFLVEPSNVGTMLVQFAIESASQTEEASCNSTP